MKALSPVTVVEQFNDCINRQDLSELAGWMSETHRFVDSAGNAIVGKTACLEAWRGFFTAFPDYKNHFDQIEENGEVVTVIGVSQCSDPRLDGSALWKAVVRENLIDEWHVLDDTEDMRLTLGLST